MTEATIKEPYKNICKAITRERVKNAIEEFQFESGFNYFRVGKPMNEESLLAGELPSLEKFSKYIFYLCTGKKLSERYSVISENLYHVGSIGNSHIYLIYSTDYERLSHLALNLDLAERIINNTMGKKQIVYAPACFLDEDYLNEKSIDFVNIPYELFKHEGNES
jgi:adenine-specific DNA-methyltransferase